MTTESIAMAVPIIKQSMQPSFVTLISSLNINSSSYMHTFKSWTVKNFCQTEVTMGRSQMARYCDTATFVVWKYNSVSKSVADGEAWESIWQKSFWHHIMYCLLVFSVCGVQECTTNPCLFSTPLHQHSFHRHATDDTLRHGQLLQVL